MIYRHGAFSFATAAMPLTEVLVAVSNPCVDPFPRVSGKKSTKRTKSINGPLYVFRGRINTEVMEVENVEDGTGWCLSCHLRYKDHPFMQFSHSMSIFPHLLVMSNVNFGPTLDVFILISQVKSKKSCAKCFIWLLKSSWWMYTNQAAVDSLGGVSYLYLVSNRMQLATSCINASR